MTARALLLTLAACGTAAPPAPAPAPASATTPVAPTPPPAPAPPPPRLACRDLPAGACAQLKAHLGAAYADDAAAPTLARCADPVAAGTARVGEWRYALVAPLYSPVEDLPDLAHAPALAATADAIAALGLHADTMAVLPPAAHPVVDAAHWAIVPADELSPGYHVVTLAGAHPLTAADQPLAIPLCAPAAFAAAAGRIANIDPDALTVIAMTGTTAPTRYMARLMDHRGVTYPARDVADWFAGADFVHVSNEVSFTPACTKPGVIGMEFCARESYIALLEQIHASIIELDGSHLTDHGTDAFAHTLDLYAARDWHWFGGGRDQIEATKVLELDHHGNRIAFVGCNMPKTTADVIHNGPNVAACDLERIAWEVGDLRRRGVLPIVAIQHEEVYVHDPPDSVVRDFRKLAEQGAAMVFGSQAHCAHPFEMHHGAYVHYGAGNFWFDQENPLTRDGTVDRLYIHAGRLLTVGHLYTRLEEQGRPRPLSDRERAGFLDTLAAAQRKLAKAKPWEPQTLVVEGIAEPESYLVGTRLVRAFLVPPKDLDATKHYPLVIAMHGSSAYKGGDLLERTDHFTFAPYGVSGAHALAAARAYVLAKYPAIDPAQVTIAK